MSIIERAMGQKSDGDQNAGSTQAGLAAELKERGRDETPVSTKQSIDVAAETESSGDAGNIDIRQSPASEPEQTASGASARSLTNHPGKTISEYPPAELNFADIVANGFIDPTGGVSRLTEEYQHVKRRVIGNTVDGVYEGPGASNLIMVTSSIPNEGKTFTSINLALSIAMEVDRTVLVIDTDIIKSDLTKFFGLVNRPGLFDVLGHPEIDISEVICKTNVPGLSVVPAGTDMQGITEKLASDGMRQLTLELAQRYPDRLVIFDSPPILATSSARAMAGYVGQTILVVEACRTPKQTIKHAIAVMEPITLAGLVLNKSRYRAAENSYYYGYSYGYGYGYDPDKVQP